MKYELDVLLRLMQEPGSTQPAEDCQQEKIQLSITVDELSLLLKLMHDNKIILNDNYREVLRTVCNTFSTKKQKNISFINLKNKSYDVNPDAVKKLENLFMTLFNSVRDY